MAYLSRDIRDRVAVDDDCFYIRELGDGKVKLVPAPTSVSEVGTDVNKELLQPIEDRVVWLMNRVFNDVTSNPFDIDFNSIDGLTVTGIWNTSLNRIEC